MAWTAPRTWVVGEVVTAAVQNTHVRDNLLYLKTHTDLYDAHDAADAQAAHVTLGAHGIGDHTDVTRTFFISTMGALTDGNVVALGQHQVIALVDGAEKFINVEFKCPNDLVTITTFRVVWSSPAGGGSVRLQGESDYGASSETYSNASEDTGEFLKAAAAASVIKTDTLAGLFVAIDVPHYCGLLFRRHGDDGTDTLADTMNVYGFLLTYTAEQ